MTLRSACGVALPFSPVPNQTRPVRRQLHARVLAAVLFTDVVDSTRIATEIGDARWHTLLTRHHDEVRRALRRFDGELIDTAGDGVFATFPTPAAAIRCACVLTERVRTFGVEIRS